MFPVLRTLGRHLANAVAECNYAQRRLTVLKTSPDSYLFNPSQAPDTYEAFLFRTSGPLTHEPSAAQRSSGHLVG
jgi:hypothetical protein